MLLEIISDWQMYSLFHCLRKIIIVFSELNYFTKCQQKISIFRSDIETLQFQLTFEIPNIRAKAKYQSSGILILVRASGAGDYWGEYGKKTL